MYEHRSQPLLPRRPFLRRLGAHGAFAFSLILVSLGIGMLGYHFLGREAWLDAFLNAAMLLGGMGQVGDVVPTEGKIFAGIFALYSGIFIIAVTGIVLLPLLHRILHRMHVEETKVDESDQG